MSDLRYFKESEFTMGGENVYHQMDGIFLDQLDELRHMVAMPMKITSSYRSPDYNASIGGASKSMHLKGRAVDVACINSRDRMVIVQEALALGLTVGVAKTFIHIDDRDYQIVFTY